MSESKEIRVLRMIEWERAKGSLSTIMQTYWGNEIPSHLQKEPSKYELMESAIKRFIKEVENDELQC